MPIPKEHGAWALLYAPFLIVALVVGQPGWRLLFLLLTLTGLFLAHEPMAKLSRTNSVELGERRRLWSRWLVAYMATAAAAASVLIFAYQLWALIPFGLAVSLLLGVHLRLVARKEEKSLPGEILGVIGLTTSAPVTYYVLTGRLDSQAVLLWLLNLIFFSGGVFYVKMRVSRAIGKGPVRLRTWSCLLYHALLAVALYGLVWLEKLPALVLLAYLPIVARAFWPLIFAPRGKLNFRRIGYSEVAYTTVFVLILAWSF